MSVFTRFLACNPTALAKSVCNPPVQGCCRLKCDKWPAGILAHQITRVQIQRFLGADTGRHVDARLAQAREPLPRHPRIRIFDCRHDACNASGNQRLRTWWRFSMMIAGLKRDICRCAARCGARSIQCLCFRVGSSACLRPTPANHSTRRARIGIELDEDASNCRIWPNPTEATPRQPKGGTHVHQIGRIIRLGRLRH